MAFDTIRKFFSTNADDQKVKLTKASNTEVNDMARLILAAEGTRSIEVADKLPDDTQTSISAAVSNMLTARNNPEYAARMAWANPELG